MMRRALSGLALFGCLMASGWAWLEIAEPVDVTGMYVRIVNVANGPEVCAATDDVQQWGMRVEEAQVVFANEVCEIASRREDVRETTEGRSSTTVLELVCSDDPAGPEGQSATLYMGAWPELTSYISVGSGYVPSHATFRSCDNLLDNGS